MMAKITILVLSFGLLTFGCNTSSSFNVKDNSSAAQNPDDEASKRRPGTRRVGGGRFTIDLKVGPYQRKIVDMGDSPLVLSKAEKNLNPVDEVKPSKNANSK